MRRFLPLFLCLLAVLPVSAQTQEEEAGRYLETMIGAIREGNDPMRNRMFIKLRIVGNPAVGPLLGALSDETSEVRHYVSFTLGFFDDPRVVDPLLGVFRSDVDLSVRCAAAEALGRLQSAEAVDPLIAALDEGEAKIRQSAAYALGLVGDPRARPALEKAKSDADELVRFFAEEALVEIDRAEARRKS